MNTRPHTAYTRRGVMLAWLLAAAVIVAAVAAAIT